MATEFFYICDQCQTRRRAGYDEPKWWQLFCINTPNEENGKSKVFCTTDCLKLFVDHKVESEKPWHFFVKTETHPVRGFLLCNPMKQLDGKDDVNFPSTSVKEDVSCEKCKQELLKQAVRRT